MGEALLAGLLAADWAPAGEVRVVEALAPRRAELTERFPDIEVTDTVGPAEGTVLAGPPRPQRAGVGGRVVARTAGRVQRNELHAVVQRFQRDLAFDHRPARLELRLILGRGHGASAARRASCATGRGPRRRG